jgi:4-amino-4-deoxy-L-arabinose transferase-like glycosyltransferase
MNMSLTSLPPADNSSRHLKIYWLLIAAAVIRLWVMPMQASLWLDETVTYWSAYKGIAAAITRSQFWPGQNMVYTMLAALMIRLAGPSEIVLRLPSLLAAIATAWLLFRFGTDLFDKETGVLATLVFVSLDEMMRTAANARPYAIALLLVVGSTLLLVRYLRTGTTAYLLAYVPTAAAIVYFHLLFAIIYPVHALYVFTEYRAGTLRIPWRNLVLGALLVGLLLSPLAWNTLQVKGVSVQSSVGGTPDSERLLTAFLPPVLASCVFLGWVTSLFIPGMTAKPTAGMRSATAVLLSSWLILPVLLLFSLARFTAFKIFVPRYYLPMFPALALLIGWGIRSLVPPRARVWVGACVVLGAMASFAGFHFRVSPFPDDWRAAASSVKQAGIDKDTPVLFRSGLIETTTIRWNTNVDPDSPLLCPLSRYPVPGRPILLPFRLKQVNLSYMENVTSSILEPSSRFVLMARHDDEFRAWLVGRLSDRGFVATDLYESEWLSVTLFTKSAINR